MTGTIVAYSVKEILQTLFSIVGICVVAENNDDIVSTVDNLSDGLNDYIINTMDFTAEKEHEILNKIEDIVADAQITGKIKGLTNDVFGCLKGFANNIYQSLNVAPVLNEESEKIFLDAGWDNITFNSSMTQIIQERLAKNNVLVTTIDANCIAISTLTDTDIQNNNIVIVDNGQFISLYNTVTGITISSKLFNTYYIYKQQFYANSSESFLPGTWVSKILYVKNLKVYNSLKDAINLTKYKNLMVASSVSSLWNKYGNLDNLNLTNADGKTIDQVGTMDLDVVPESVWDRVNDGTVALDDVIPVPLSDSKDGTIINNANNNDSSNYFGILGRILSVLSAILSAIISIPGKLLNVITAIPDIILDGIKELVTSIVNVLEKIFDAILNIPSGIINILQKILDVILDIPKGIIDILQKILEAILSLPLALIEALTNFLEWLFVPNDVIIAGCVSDLNDSFNNKFGILTFPIALVTDFLNDILNLGSEDCILTIPEIKFKNYVVVKEYVFNFTEYMHKSELKQAYDFYILISDVILIFLVIRLLQKKVKEMTK